MAGAGIDTYEAIDVFSKEESPPEHPLVGLDNVLLTPHVAAESVDAQEEVAVGAIENVVAVLSGHWPQPDHVVNVGVEPRAALAPYDAALFERRQER